MKRILVSRWMQLVAALVVLVGIGAFYTWVADYFPSRPRMSLQIDNDVAEMPIFSPDGKLLLTRTFVKEPSYQECKFELWEVETGKRRWWMPTDRAETHIEFSPDSKLLAAQKNGIITMWDTSDGRQRLKKQLGSGQNVWVRFSPDGRYLLFQREGRSADQIIFWDLVTNRELTRIDGEFLRFSHDDKLADRLSAVLPHGEFLRFSHDGKRFATVQKPLSPNESYNVSLWAMPEDDSQPRLLKRKWITVTERPELFTCTAFVCSPDLQTCALAERDDVDWNKGDVIQRWDLSSNEEMARLIDRHSEQGLHFFDGGKVAKHLEFGPNGQFLLASFEGNARDDWNVKVVAWNAQGELQTVRFVGAEPLISPCGRWILSPYQSGADVWEIGTQRKQADLRRQTDHDAGLPMAVAGLPPWLRTTDSTATYQFSSDGRFVMVTGYQTTTTPNLLEMMFTGQWNRINTAETVSVGRLWDVERDEEIATFYHCTSAQLSPDGHTLATLDENHRLQFWTVPAQRPFGLIMALTTVTWGLVLLVCWAERPRFGRQRRATVSMPPQAGTPSPAPQA